MGQITLRDLLSSPLPDPGPDPDAAVAVAEDPAVVRAREQASRALADILAAADPRYRERLREPITRAVESSALDLTEFLLGTRPRASFTGPQHEVVLEIVRLGIPFRGNAHGLRLTQRGWQRMLFDLIESGAPPACQPALMREAADRVGAYFDEVADLMVTDYLNEQQRFVARQVADQREMVTALIGGGEPGPKEITQALGIDLDQHHLGLVIWDGSRAPGRAGKLALGQTARAIAGRLDCPAPLLVAADIPGTLWAWLTHCRPVDVDGLRGFIPRDPAVRVAAGSPGQGTAGFRRTHLTALDARAVSEARLMPARVPAEETPPSGKSVPGKDVAAVPPVTLYRDVALLAPLVRDRERAAWYIEDELGALAEPGDPAACDLRLTALMYLETGGSLVATAQRLHVHRNTVVYRLKRITGLLGRPLTARTLETHAALRLAVALS